MLSEGGLSQDKYCRIHLHTVPKIIKLVKPESRMGLPEPQKRKVESCYVMGIAFHLYQRSRFQKDGASS